MEETTQGRSVSQVWTHEQVRALHQHYLQHPELAPEALARQHGVSRSGMYRLFEREGLVGRRLRTERGAAPPDAQQLRQMHEEYLRSSEHPWKVARRWGLSQRKMYQLFDLAGLAGRRAVERARARGAQAKELCSEMDQHGFCPWCPCPPPPCSGGHSGDQDAEWHCGDCRWPRRCACWDAALRARYGWCEAHERWRREREVRQATVARMQACAAACMNSPGGPPPVQVLSARGGG